MQRERRYEMWRRWMASGCTLSKNKLFFFFTESKVEVIVLHCQVCSASFHVILIDLFVDVLHSGSLR